MRWRGDELKRLVDASDMTHTAFSKAIGVSRRTFADWTTKSQVPKGTHLLKMCNLLKISPDELFEDDLGLIMVPAHRTRKNAKVTEEVQDASLTLVKEYEALFSDCDLPLLRPTCPAKTLASATELGKHFRQMVGLAESPKPLDFEHTFKLAEQLRICLIFRTFPEQIKDYAFYTRIHDHRVVFVNRQNNLLDTIFAMLHEFAHAIRDQGNKKIEEYSKEEEDFCDEVANSAQFPAEYIETVWRALEGKKSGQQVNILKDFAQQNFHAIYGLLVCLEKRFQPLKIGKSIHGADTNLHNSIKKIYDIMVSDSAREYVRDLSVCCPYLMRVLKDSIDSLSPRKLSELLDIASILDARDVLTELKEELRLESAV